MPRGRQWRFALPGAQLPARVEHGGVVYLLQHTYKHDFFAGTGRYRGGDRDVVIKFNRVNDACGLPLDWIGRFLARREAELYQLTSDLPGVPEWLGRVGATGVMHAYVPGRPLGRDDAVADAFFPQLDALLDAMHARSIAYVDLNKRQNVLLGDDGRPYLIDFQISLHLPRRGWRRLAPVQWMLRRFQLADRYHLLKHKRRLRPDQLAEGERVVVERLSIWIRLHRLIARPITQLRRRILRRVDRGEHKNVPGFGAK